MAELQPVGVLEKLSAEPDPHRFVILTGLDVAQARKKPIRDALGSSASTFTLRWWRRSTLTWCRRCWLTC